MAVVILQIYYWIMACANTKDGPKYLVNPFHFFDEKVFTEAGNRYRINLLIVSGVLLIIFLFLAYVSQ